MPYSGGVYVALLSGQVDAMFESMPGPVPHLAAGKLRALGVTGNRRLSALPDVPTLAEQGIAGIDVNSWWGFVGPAGMDKAIVDRLNVEITRALLDAETASSLARMGIEASPGTPAAFGSYIAQEYSRWQARLARVRPKTP